MFRILCFLWGLAAVLLFSVIAEAECTRQVIPHGDWRRQGILWKPVAEHVGKPVVVLTEPAKLVRLFTLEGEKIATLPFRSFGDAGYAYQLYLATGLELRRRHGRSLLLRVRREGGQCREYLVKPQLRSDGGGR